MCRHERTLRDDATAERHASITRKVVGAYRSAQIGPAAARASNQQGQRCASALNAVGRRQETEPSQRANGSILPLLRGINRNSAHMKRSKDADGLEQGMAEANHTAPHRLLAVEDDLDCSDLIVRTARKCGYAALPALDARSMDETIRNWRPHVITLDLCLPEIDGMEVISLIKKTDFAGPLIIISGQPEWIRDLTGRMASESGLKVPAQMSKPIHLPQLRELLMLIRASLPASSDTGSGSAAGSADAMVPDHSSRPRKS